MTTNKHQFILFWATGDLARRYVLEALIENMQPSDTLFALGRWNPEAISQKLEKWSKVTPFQLDVGNQDDYNHLAETISQKDWKRIFYVSLDPQYFWLVLTNLAKAKKEELVRRWDSIIFEKPFGVTEADAKELHNKAIQLFGEDHVYKIDHYLGKSFVQNAIEFARTLDWRTVKTIDIHALESLTILDRGEYYDSAWVVKDMIMTHLFQTMLKVLWNATSQSSLLSWMEYKVHALWQYDGYLKEQNVALQSQTPTFWTYIFGNKEGNKSHVITHLRSGKALKEKDSSITFYDHSNNKLKRFQETDANKNNAYTFLIREVLDEKSHDFFPSQSSIEQAWKLFSPILEPMQWEVLLSYEPGTPFTHIW